MFLPSALALGCTLLFPCGPRLCAAESEAPSPVVTARITAAELRAHVEYLAGDGLQGRGLTSKGLVEAAHYLAREFERVGLEPAGDDGTFLQAMVFGQTTYEALPEMTLRGERGEDRSLIYGADFRLLRSGEQSSLRLVVLREGDAFPAPDPDIALCFVDQSRGKAARWLKSEGHADGAGYGAVITFLRRAGEATTEIPRASRPALKKETRAAAAPLWLSLSPDLREELASGVLVELSVTPHRKLQEFTSYNVIGRLPGTGTTKRPELAQQAIVVSAHYDHLGTVSAERTPEDAGEDFDSIYNGADDDASGVATVLEIAEALASKGPQAREVLFLMATAEEINVVGTSFYLDHPSTPLERTVANLNFEMVGRPDENVGGAGRLWLSGHERTNLMAAYEAAGLKIGADPYPEQNFFERSDNIVFCRRGIVGQTFSTYNLHDDYHTTRDEADTLDYDHMESCARAGLRAVQLIASGAINPEWLEGGRPRSR